MRVVLSPELLGAAFLDADCRRITLLWRDGLVKPVLCRELLLRYLKVLREMGLGADLLRQWSLWLTTADKALYLGEPENSTESLDQLCARVAEAGQARAVVTWHKRDNQVVTENSKLKWSSASEYLATGMGRL